jgi:DNA-binding IclR family transcriptional regulator
MSYPYAEALLLQLDGERLVAQGEPTRAWKRWEEALAIFRRLGARWDVEQVEQDIAALACGVGAASRRREPCVRG